MEQGTSQTHRQVTSLLLDKASVSKDRIRPGDLIVFNNDGNWGHVGLYIGSNKMIHAPRTGKNVEEVIVAPGTYWDQFPWAIRHFLPEGKP
ncbi:C40 family peptidase [Streptomyces alkaliterrae]|uniref:C40 family peptidase n=1 Tax=Streptomyces alkaliterrae TaxID=2213162 RepID=UPI002B20C88B|nr:NlpC/P60 family protein [Streptomyces alkaliterrae]